MSIGSGSEPYSLNEFDVRIELFLNHFVNRSHAFDWVMAHSDDSTLLRGGVIMLLVWYALFEPHEEGKLRERHELLLGATLLSMVAIVAARGLALTLPFRPRPIGIPALHFQPPLGLSHPGILGWSSFPSDHAVLFFTIATGILFVSRPLGWLATGWVAAVICFPRLYVGFHWPTDILAGALLGVSFAHIARIPAFREMVKRLAGQLHREQPGIFFALLFLLSCQIVNLFDEARRIGTGLWHLMRS